MSGRSRGWIVAAVVALVAALAVSGTALAVSGGKRGERPTAAEMQKEHEQFLADVAAKLGVSVADLKAALTSARLKQVDRAVASGRLTKEQGETIKKAIESGQAPLGFGPRMGGKRGFGFGHGPGMHAGPGLGAAAAYLGTTQAALVEQLRSGKSLADVVKATPGKTVEGLKKAMLADLTKKLDQAVADKKITAAQRDAVLEKMSKALDAMIAGTMPKLRFGGHHDRSMGGMGGMGGALRMAPAGWPI